MKKLCYYALFLNILLLPTKIALGQSDNLYLYGSNYEDVKAKVTAQQGDYYLVGSYGGGDPDILLTKLNNFSVEWSKTYDHGNKEQGYDLVVDDHGNHFLSATGNNLSSTIYLKLSRNGSPLVSKKIGNYHDRIRYITPLKDGSLLFYGELEGAISGNNQLALFKTDKNLNPIWEKVITHENSSDYRSDVELYGREVLELNDGCLIFLTSYTAYNNAQNDRALRLIKLAPDGSLLWVKGYDNIRADNPNAILADYNNGFVICGVSNSYNAAGTNDVQIIKVDGSGNVEWAKVIGGDQDEHGYKITKTSDNGYLVGGTTKSFGKGQNDVLLLKLNQQGTLQWAKTFGGMGEEVISNLFALGQKIVLSGYSNSFSGRRYQTFLYEIQDLGQLQAACFEDISSRIQVNDIALNTFNTLYSVKSFNTPANVSLTVQSPEVYTEEKCLSCFDDQVYDFEICPSTGETLSLDAWDEEASAYLWENGSTNASQAVNSAGVYKVTVYYEFCLVKKTFNVSLIHSKEVNLGADVSSCQGGPVSLQAPAGLADGTFAWSTGSTSRSLVVTTSGKYWLHYESPCGRVTDTVQVQISAPPSLSLGEDLILCKGEELQLNARFSGAALAWSDGSEGNSMLISSPGKYWASIENECGIASDTVYVYNKSMATPFVPNVFTPNEDTFNDAFVIDEQLTGAVFSVYNRWGKRVYFSPAYDHSWKAKGLAKGTYYVKINDACTGLEFIQPVTIIY